MGVSEEYWVLECDCGLWKSLHVVHPDHAKLLPDWKVVYRGRDKQDAQEFIDDVEPKNPKRITPLV